MKSGGWHAGCIIEKQLKWREPVGRSSLEREGAAPPVNFAAQFRDYGISTTGVRQKADFCSPGLNTETWQV
jgi:hypothetical protein